MSSAFPKAFAVGTGYIEEIFNDDVEVTEKIDGSQFGFGLVDGQLIIRSKGKEQLVDAPDKMFQEAADFVKSIAYKLGSNMFYYCEYLQKPKHSTLAYDRIPKNHLVLFGAMGSDGTFVSDYNELKDIADFLEIDVVPLLYKGHIGSAVELFDLLDKESYLGGQKVEGVVVKAYRNWLFGSIPFPVMVGKYVSEQFKEVHRRDWTKDNTVRGKWDKFKESYRSDARWHKAVMHLDERGELTRTPQDIGKLIKEVQLDVALEEQQIIKDFLYKEFADELFKRSTAGLPEWYKAKLVEDSFARSELAGSNDGNE